MSRYEYRAWGDDLAGLAARLVELGEPREVRHSEETYIVAPSEGVNPKIRADLLDVKVLLDLSDGFERWEPRLKLEFPLAAGRVHELLEDLLGVAPADLGREWYTSAEFISEVVVPHPGLHEVKVSKHRSLYDLTGCIGETSDVMMGERRLQTVAVESEDLDSLQVLCQQIGMGVYANRSYPAVIREVLQAAAGDPEEAAWESRSNASTS